MPVSWESLTPTERTVLRLLARGLTNAGIADELVVSPNTVKTHVSRILAKLEVRTREEAAGLYLQRLERRRRRCGGRRR